MPFNPNTASTEFSGSHVQSGFSVKELFSLVNTAVISAKSKLLEIQRQRSSISIGDMFELQMLMNNLSQISEMATSVLTATHNAIYSMARNMKS